MSKVTLNKGDHISTSGYFGFLYRHHMLVEKVLSEDVHNGTVKLKVIHKAKKSSGGSITDEEVTVKRKDLIVHDSYSCKYSADAAVERARRMMNDDDECDKYNLRTNNCEHFVRQTKTGEKKCLQFEQAGVGIASGVAGAAGGAATGNNTLYRAISQMFLIAGAGVGAIVGFLLPVPGATLIGAAVGAGIGGTGIGGAGAATAYTTKRIYDEQKRN